MNNSYDAHSIKILSDEELRNKFLWLQAGDIAKQYNQPLKFVTRGLEVCYRLGLEPDYFIEKYLRKNKVEEKKEFSEVYKELMEDERQGKAVYLMETLKG